MQHSSEKTYFASTKLISKRFLVAISVIVVPMLVDTANSAVPVAIFDFESYVPTSNPVFPDKVQDSAAALPNHDLLRTRYGTGYEPANLYGNGMAATRLGQSGRTSEPVEPAPSAQQYEFRMNSESVEGNSWTVLMWFNRHDLDNFDFLMYIGAGDGFGGTGAEFYVFGHPDGRLVGNNYSSNSTQDLDLGGGTTVAGQWHQMGVVRDGSSLSLYLDGDFIGTDSSVNITAQSLRHNIHFGAPWWMRLDYMRRRVHDGLIDQIEIYESVLNSSEIQERYNAFAIPEPSAVSLAGLACVGVIAWRRHRKRA